MSASVFRRVFISRSVNYWHACQRPASRGDAYPKSPRLTTSAVDDLDVVVAHSHAALGEFVNGDPEPFKQMWSQRDDVSLANPYGPAVRGWEQVATAMDRAATHYKAGEFIGYESVAKSQTQDLAYIVGIERFTARIAGGEAVVPFALRVTSVFRMEVGAWRIVHRHADSITTLQPDDSMLRQS